MDAECELEKDFEAALEKIDFEKYNPRSAEFQDALSVGLMRFLLCKEKGGASLVPSKWTADVELRSAEEKGGDGVFEELGDAKKYLQKFIETRDETFREMARDEIRHARALMKKALARLPSAEEKTRIKRLDEDAEEISRCVEKA